MKKILLLICLGVVVTLCSFFTTKKTSKNIDQLYILMESIDLKTCQGVDFEEGGIQGGLYFTPNGHVIFAPLSLENDTARYYWGTYQLTEGSFTYELTNEYYTYLTNLNYMKNGSDTEINPEYLNGKTRKIKLVKRSLTKHNCKDVDYAYNYTDEEKAQAKKRLNNRYHPDGFTLMPYKETPNMKYYTWLFKQIPCLAKL